ncbi:putative reverse transcriptase, RNA-dependent DNA polymerase, partial [Tanacetum coccineum]
NPQQVLNDKGVIDSGCSRHMTRNISYLTDYKEIDGGFVTFGGNSKGGKLLGKDSPNARFKPSGEEEKNDAEDLGNEDSEVPKADIKNLDTHIPISPIPTTRIHKDHPVEQIIRDIYSAPQTRRMTKSVTEHVMFSSVQQRTNHKDFQNCLFACFLSQEEPNKVIQALKDPSWIEAMQKELLQFKLQQVWTLMNLPNGKRAIGTKWVYKNKKGKRGIVIKNKARLVTQGYTQEEGIYYDEMDVKSAFLYGKIEEDVYVCQPPRFEDSDFHDRVYKVEKALYGLHQAPRAWTASKAEEDKYVTEILKKFGLSDVKTASTPMKTQKALLKDADGEDVDEHLYRSMIGSLMIFRYLNGQPKLGLWYPKNSPFDLVAYTDSDYVGASLDRKSTTGGCQFLGCRLISWQCKKQTMVANSTTEAEYIAASNCLKNPVFHSKTKHIEIRHHFIRDSNEKKLIQMIKIHTDQNVTDLLTKAFDVSRFQYLITSIGMLNL